MDYILWYLIIGFGYWIWVADSEANFIVIPTWPIDLIIRAIKYYRNTLE